MKTGDIIQLGEHRIAIGSATDKDLVSRLLDGDKVKSVITDPPHRDDRNQDVYKQKFKGEEAEGDLFESDVQYIQFTKDWIRSILDHMDARNTFYVFNYDLTYPALRSGMEQAGLHYSQQLVWDKMRSSMSRQDYNSQHELIAYGWFKRHEFVKAKGNSVFRVPRPNSKLHPAMKPVSLIRQFLGDGTRVNDVVYDGFLGSGSTLIACEHMHRKCRGVEIDISSIKTTIARWEKLTGDKHKVL